MSRLPSPPPRQVAGQTTELWTWAALVMLALAAAAAVWAFKPHSAVTRAKSPAPAAETLSADNEARTYLDAAEQFAGEKRFEPAFEMVAKAGLLKIKDPALNIRLTRMRYAVTSALWLNRASNHLERGQWASAMDAAKAVLEVDPANSAAAEILGKARTGAEAAADPARPGDPVLDPVVEGRPLARRPPPGTRRTAAAEPAHRLELPDQPPEPPRRPAPHPPAPPPEGLAAVPVDPFSTPAPPAAPSLPPKPPARPAAQAPAPPPPARAPTSGPTLSAMPKAQVPLPVLPRVYVSQDGEALARVCQAVESSVISLAGVSPEFARGITASMRRQVRTNAPIYPIAMYYFIVREAALRRDNATAAANLAAAQSSGTIVHLKDLPGIDKSL
jgi:hypothetical protein